MSETEKEKVCVDELRVKEILKERGMKMKELAEIMGIVPETLTRALQQNPRYSTLRKIATNLGVQMRDLFKDTNAKEEYKEMRGCIFFNNEMFTFNTRNELDEFLKQN